MPFGRGLAIYFFANGNGAQGSAQVITYQERHTTLDKRFSHFIARSLNEQAGEPSLGLSVMTTEPPIV